MTQLEFVNTTEFTHLNTLLYGPPKSGKTLGAASAPGPVLYLNADRPNATHVAHQKFDIKEVKAEGLQSLIDVIQELDGETDFESVVVDPVGELYRTILEDLSGRALSPAINLYKDTGTHLERFCRALCELPVNVVFCLHELKERDEDSGAFERLPYTGTKNPVLAAKLMGMVDVIGYTGVITENEEKKYLAQLVDGGGRRGGDRYGALGSHREVNITEWVGLTHAANRKES